MNPITICSEARRAIGAPPTQRPLSILVCFLMVACGGDDAGERSEDAESVDDEVVTSVNLPARNPELAPQGEELFTTRACVSCHTIGGGRLVGPDLEDVTERRSREWILAMIANPDSMLRADTTARRLLAEYFTPMVNQGLTVNDAAAIYEYLVVAGANAGNANDGD